MNLMLIKLRLFATAHLVSSVVARYRRLVLACLAIGLLFIIIVRPTSPHPGEHGGQQQVDGTAEREAYSRRLQRVHNQRQDGAIAAFQTERQQLVKRGCKNRRPIDKLSRFEHKLLFDQILVNDRYRFLYCFTPKVACSNWKKVLMTMDGKALSPENITKIDHARDVKHLYQYSDEEIEHRLETYYKFMFVREPMARLASAFLNKFREIPSYMKKYGVQIVKRYRPNPPDKPKGNDVTWNEFVRYLVDTPLHRYNQHWMPYHTLCQPCAVDYDFIGSYENLESEANYVIRQVQADRRVAFPPRQKYYKPLKQEQLHSMLQDTPADQLEKLIALYQEDFDLFGYSPPSLYHKKRSSGKD